MQLCTSVIFVFNQKCKLDPNICRRYLISTKLCDYTSWANLLGTAALPTVQTSIPVCTYVCRSLKRCVDLPMAIAINKHPFSPPPITFLVKWSFRLMPVWHSEDYLSLSLSPPCFLYVSSFRALLGYMLLDFITGKVQSISGLNWPPNV